LALKSVICPSRSWKTEVYWFYGGTGTGKSREAFRLCSGRSGQLFVDGGGRGNGLGNGVDSVGGGVGCVSEHVSSGGGTSVSLGGHGVGLSGGAGSGVAVGSASCSSASCEGGDSGDAGGDALPSNDGRGDDEGSEPLEPYVKMGGNKWWDGYDGDQDVIIDDYRRDLCPFHELLRLFDRYPMKVECKGYSTQFLAKRIFVTCPQRPELIWEGRGAEDLKQLTRRITEIRYFADVDEPVVF